MLISTRESWSTAGAGPKMKNRVKSLRTARKWSQTELGEKLGVSRQSIHAIETGKHDPSLPLAFRIASLFKLRVEEIFEDSQKS
ncbi:helix-turn-helix transcriptional regulator [Sphingomonas daechungensis]